MTPAPKNTVSGIQVYNAFISTISAIVIGIILNNVWELKEFKGEITEWKESVNKNNDELKSSIQTHSILISKRQEREGDLENRIIKLEAVLPEESRQKRVNKYSQ